MQRQKSIIEESQNKDCKNKMADVVVAAVKKKAFSDELPEWQAVSSL